MENTIKAAALFAAIKYVTDPRHGDTYAFPMVVSKQGLSLYVISRDQLLNALTTERALELGHLKIEGNVCKVRSHSLMTLRQTYGAPKAIIKLDGYKDYKSLPLDPSECAGRRARTFEKLACKALGYKWVGGLNNVQIDGIGPHDRLEVKGMRGRIDAYMPSRVDKD